MMGEQDIVSTLAKELTMKNLLHYRKNSTKTWQIVFTHPYIKGKRIKQNTSFKFHEKKLAKIQAEQMYSKIRLQHTHSNLFSKHTLFEAIEGWLEMKPRSKTEKGHVDKFKLLIGDKDLKHINKDDYLKIVKWNRNKGNSDSSIDRYMDTLKTVLNHALDNEWIERFPKIKKYDTNKWEKGHRLSEEEKNILIQAMYDTGHTHLIDPFLFALLTGLRRSNVAGLTKSHILDGIGGQKEIHFAPHEMKWKRKHSIALTDEMYALLKRNITKDSEYIFRGYNNRKKLGDFKKSWETVRAVAGVLNQNTGKYVRWHDLRHTCASDYAEKGISAYELKALMHWQSLKMADKYVHMNSNIQRISLEKFAPKFVPDLSHKNNTCNKRRDSYNVGMAERLTP